MEFKDKDLEAFWNQPDLVLPRRVPGDIRRGLYRKIQMLEAARSLNDLRVPPSNHLEKLKGDRAGCYSIRVNEKWRLCFAWIGSEAREVEFVDYH